MLITLNTKKSYSEFSPIYLKNLFRFINNVRLLKIISVIPASHYKTGKLPSQKFCAVRLISIVQNSLLWFKRQCLPEDWQSCSYQRIRDELINCKAIVTEHSGHVQINFSVYFKYKQVLDFAIERAETVKNGLDQGKN